MTDTLLQPATDTDVAITPEDELVDRATQGDAEAFAELYDRHVDRIFRHISFRVSDHTEAEDLTQQAFLQAWNAMGRYKRTAAPFGAWLMRIAHNLVISFYRRHRTHEEINPEAHRSSEVDSPERVAMRSSTRETLNQAITQLAPVHQQVIIMRFIEQASYAEIAYVLGRKEGSVRVIQHRALQRLRAILDKSPIPPNDL